MTKSIRYGAVMGYATALLLMILFFPSLIIPKPEGDNYYTIFINGQEAAHTESPNVSEYLRAARLQLARDHEGMFMAVPDITIEPESAWLGVTDSPKALREIFASAILDAVKETLNPSYVVKAGSTSVALGSKEETIELLNRILEPYDDDSLYKAQIVSDPERELSVLTPDIVRRSEEERALISAGDFHKLSGASLIMDGQAAPEDIDPMEDKSFEDFELGITAIDYGKDLEVVETYLPKSELLNVNEALDRLTTQQEQQLVYKVVAGDSLSQIAEDYGIPMNRLVDINPTIESDRDTIKIGQEIIITQPKPELSVKYSELSYYEEDYEADVTYVDNNDWYTNQTKVIQQPSAGHRKVVALVSYENESVISQEIAKEELVIEAIPKIVERGTKIPPTFIKPISGGRVSSGFGRRKAPTKGASTYHKGIDWAIPVGTTVVASSGGTVSRAGWGSGYGYVVYINHGDGRETRYGHLSRVLVKVGQKVRQGEKIALSGNTGRSTGPHIHFEILVNGAAVDPSSYMS